jgi:hypothetical protein
MTTPIAIFALYAVQTADEWLDYGLGLARIAGLPVDSWRVGDPTRSLYKYVAEALGTKDLQDAEFVKAGFLSTAEGDWLTVHADEVFGIERDEATYATPTVTITNSGGGRYPLAAGDLTVQASSTGKTYHNTDEHVDPGDILEGGATITFTLVADEEGSGSSVATDEIDTIVSPALLGCAIDSSTSATAADGQDDDSLRTDCAETLGALSPNGPADAYNYVVRNSDLTGTTEITRSASLGDTGDGTTLVYVAGPSGAVSGGAVTAAQDAVRIWAEPLCIEATVVNAAASVQALTFTLSGDDIPADFEDLVEDAYGAYLATLAIGGFLAVSRLHKLIHDTIPAADTVEITVPAADVDLAVGVVATAGTVTGVEV